MKKLHTLFFLQLPFSIHLDWFLHISATLITSSSVSFTENLLATSNDIENSFNKTILNPYISTHIFSKT